VRGGRKQLPVRRGGEIRWSGVKEEKKGKHPEKASGRKPSLDVRATWWTAPWTGRLLHAQSERSSREKVEEGLGIDHNRLPKKGFVPET